MKQRNRLAGAFIIVVACVLMQACRAYYSRADRLMKFDGLPKKVQNTFLEAYAYCPDSVGDNKQWDQFTQPVVMHGYNVSGDTVTITPAILATCMDMEKGVIVRTNSNIFKFDFIFLDGICVIEGDTIYYPIGSAYRREPGISRASVTWPETLQYGASKMSKNKFRFFKGVW